jgi:MFS family permease
MHDALTIPRTISRPERGSLATLVAATATGSIGLAAGGTAGALLAVSITGRPVTAGLPLGLLVAGSAVGALAISLVSGRLGRGRALALGYAVGAVGAVLVAVAAAGGSLAGVLAGSFLMGPANAGVFLARYAAAELAGPRARGRALGAVLAGAAVGAVAGPNLLGPSGALAAAIGLPDLAGLYLVAVPSFAIAAALLARLPVAREPRPEPPGGGGRRAGAAVIADPAARSGLRSLPAVSALALLAAANLVMVGIMAVAPLHMTEHGHELGVVGVVVSLHVLGMFVLAPGLGWLADRVGSTAVAGLGIGLLVAVGAGTTLIDPSAGASITAYLVLLGVGWSAAVVGGSALLIATLAPAARPRGEALGEVAMGLGAAGGAPGAAVVLAAGGFQALGLAGAAVAGLALAGLALAAVGSAVAGRSSATRPGLGSRA